MKIKQITETTTSGSIATVDSALGGTQSRGNPSIYGGKKVGTLFKGKKTKAPYANSVNESAELSEAHLEEDDVIVVPGQGRSRKNGLVPHGQSRLDHEVEMARSDLFSAAKNAQQVYSMIKDVSEDEGLDGWVQEKIIKANDYLNTIREYLEGKQIQGMNDQEGMAEESSKNKYSNLSNRGVNRGIKRAGDDFNRMLDLDQAESPHYKTQHQQDTKQRLKTKPMVGPKGVLPEQGEQRVDTLVTDALKIMRGAEVSDAVRALTTVLGNREYNSRRGFYNFYIRQMIDMYGKQGVAEALLGADDDYNRGQKVPDWAKRGIIGKIGRKLDPAWSDVQIVIPKHLLPKPSSAPATNAPTTKDMPKTTPAIPNRAIPQSAGTKPLQSVTKNVVKTIADKQGMLDNKNKKA